MIFEYNKIYFCIKDVFKILGITREPFEAVKMTTEKTYLMKFASRKQRFMAYMTLIFFACSKYIKVTDEAAMNFLDCVQSVISLEPFTYNELSNRIKPLDKKTLNIGSYFN